MACDANQLVNNLCTYGDLNFIHPPTTTQSTGGMLQPSSGSGLMRSKSDHRLVSQFRQQQEQSNNDDEPLLGGRKFGERPVKLAQEKATDRYGYDINEDQHYDSSSRTSKNRFRSRFVRGHHEEDDDNESSAVKAADKESQKNKIASTEDAAKGDEKHMRCCVQHDTNDLVSRFRSVERNF
jgi:tripartite motif-containing protein 71